MLPGAPMASLLQSTEPNSTDPGTENTIIHPNTHIPTIRPITLAVPSKSGGDGSGKPSKRDQATQTEPVSENGHDVNPGFTSGSGPDCYIVSNSMSKVDSEPEDKEDWPMDAVTDIFAGLYLPSSKLDAAYGPMPEEMD
ncbi:unnamed protein product [Penicillium glandicola]